jgi:predicted transcriptional regulator
MQEDMHYYGTYAMARAAGLEIKYAQVIAYAAQYVDDSTAKDSEVHEDGGMFQTIATAHTNSEAIVNAVADHIEQRHVWVPFHFFPGGKGETLSEKLTCVKNSELAQEMVKNHIRHAVSVKNEYGLALMGIMAHVYADTFSHYGFSGVSSRNNKVDGTSFVLDVKNPEVKAYIMNKFSSFLTKYSPRFIIKNYRNIASKGASVATGALGHGAVGTYPDRPFLRWKFTFKKDNRDSGWRDNPATFLEACEKLHGAFSEYAEKAGISKNPVPFDSIKKKVDEILRLESAKEGRIKAWTEAIRKGELFETEADEALYFSKHDWEQQKDDFEYLEHSHEMKEKEVYQFHQAAIYHRDYTLKNLLPKYGVVVL